METITGVNRQPTDDVPPLWSSFNHFTGVVPTFSKLGAWISGITLIVTGFFNVLFIIVVYGEMLTDVTSQSDYDVMLIAAKQLGDYYWFPYLVSS